MHRVCCWFAFDVGWLMVFEHKRGGLIPNVLPRAPWAIEAVFQGLVIYTGISVVERSKTRIV